MSLISTVKNCFILFEFVRNYFTCEWKYFYISMISGFSSFEWRINEFSPRIFYRDISGIRSSTQSVVNRSPVPNFVNKPFLVPNYDTHTKFKQNPIFRRKQAFRLFHRKMSIGRHSNFVERVNIYHNLEVHDKRICLQWVQ
jgi:hypothetical protein